MFRYLSVTMFSFFAYYQEIIYLLHYKESYD